MSMFTRREFLQDVVFAVSGMALCGCGDRQRYSTPVNGRV